MTAGEPRNGSKAVLAGELAELTGHDTGNGVIELSETEGATNRITRFDARGGDECMEDVIEHVV